MSTSRLWLSMTIVVVVGIAAAAPLFLPATPARAEDAKRVRVPHELIHFDDGDSIAIGWRGRTEHVRILGIDTPEVMHLEHDLPFAQPFGREAAGFLRGCVAAADEVTLLRSENKDKYGRTLAYLFVDGRNYSVLAIDAHLAYGPNPRFGDEGLPAEHEACMQAAARQGPLAFEEPWKYRKRMRVLSAHMRKQGTYPGQDAR